MTRTHIAVPCQGTDIIATIDAADRPRAGLLIVTGGNEIRCGAHGGLARFAARMAQSGVTCLRFDRRGVGDSDGDNARFQGSADDITAAMNALARHLPPGVPLFATGNCDGATALLLHPSLAVAGLALTNPWVWDDDGGDGPRQVDQLPPSAVRAYYRRKLLSMAAWRALASGSINPARLIAGLKRIFIPTRAAATPAGMAGQIARRIEQSTTPIHFLLSSKDMTAMAFDDLWRSPACAPARQRGHCHVDYLDSGSHSFASSPEFDALVAWTLGVIDGTTSR